jgi:hypothetical protein
MQIWLDVSAAVFAFAAALFWFASAARKLPPMRMYWNSAPPDDPFYRSVRFSVVMNKWAALLSGLSALCMGVRLVL